MWNFSHCTEFQIPILTANYGNRIGIEITIGIRTCECKAATTVDTYLSFSPPSPPISCSARSSFLEQRSTWFSRSTFFCLFASSFSYSEIEELSNQCTMKLKHAKRCHKETNPLMRTIHDAKYHGTSTTVSGPVPRSFRHFVMIM